jgi:hypothetical protein
MLLIFFDFVAVLAFALPFACEGAGVLLRILYDKTIQVRFGLG